MARLLLLQVIFQGILFSGTWAWIVRMPQSIRGLRGSCLVIPCSFDYSSNPPSNYRAVWYQYASRGYPLVYDRWYPGDVIWKFRGKTSLYGNIHRRECSLLITELTQYHHGEQIYVWIDPENISKYTYAFYDVTSKISVDTSPANPNIQIFGGNKIGDTISVQCYTYHSCPKYLPTLTLDGIESKLYTDDKIENQHIGGGRYKITLRREGIVRADKHIVYCSVRHPGDLSATSSKIHNANCAIERPQITPDSNTEFLEGVERDIICSVKYMCPNARPYISWTGGRSAGSTTDQQGTKEEARSTLKFTTQAGDHGRVITCQTEFKGNIQSATLTLRVKRSMFSRGWTFSMPNAISGVRGSCVVIPCSFDFKTSMPSNIKVKWYKFSNTDYPLVYDQSTQSIIDKFRGKTSLYGSPNERNCSLKIQPLQMQHNQERLYPWMDPKSINTYHRENYYDVTIALGVTESVEKPQLDVNSVMNVGEQFTLSCSVIHTCPPAPPTLKFSISRGNERLTHAPLSEGKWKVTKDITWDLQEDDVSVTCTVSYAGGQTSLTEFRLNPLCNFEKPTVSQATQDEVMEGIEKIFVCTVYHTCQKQKPSLLWNYQTMPASTETQKINSTTWKTVSTLTFKAAKDDHGKMLTCTAQSPEKGSSDSVILKVKRGMSSLDWTYSIPSRINGLQGSCLVIPCSFDFKTTRPSHITIKWYEYSTTAYPVVYDQDFKKVIGKYWKKTELYGSQSEQSCSLKITSLMKEHNGDRLYPWLDEKPVETFHKENYYDNGVELQVSEQPEKPQLSIIGVPRVGEQITVSCTVLHTCPPNPPSLTIGKDQNMNDAVHTSVQDGFWQTARHHTFPIKEDDQTIKCVATFVGGRTSEAQINLNAQCTYEDIFIEPEEADITEGVGQNFTCHILHSCQKKPPIITWNYKDMPETVKTKRNRGSGWVTESNMFFLASMEDNGNKLSCTATFSDGEITNSVGLQVQKYVPKIVDPFENDTMHTFEADVVPKISALTRSCVVIPCTFQFGDKLVAGLRGLWYNSKREYVYHTGRSNIMDNFKGRTKLLGNPDEQNCTLEIDDIKAHDNGPFCFRAEKGTDKYNFNHSCVFIIMKATPNKPEISTLPEELEPGKRIIISCSVTHTCSSHPPTIKWSIPITKEKVSHMETSAGQWKTTSEVYFTPTGYEPEDDLVCTASFWRGKKEESTVYLPIQRFEGMRMETIGPYILTPIFVVLLLFGIAAVCAVIYKRRVRSVPSDEDTFGKRRSIWTRFSRRSDATAGWLSSDRGNIAPPRPPKAGRASIWSRFSRRGPVTSDQIVASDAPCRPPKPEKRRSIWSRFSRRTPANDADLRMEYNSLSGNAEFLQPHCPPARSRGGRSADADLRQYNNAW